MGQIKLWTKDFIIMFFTSFFITLVYFLLVTTMAVYAIQQFNASESMAGLAASIFVIGAFISRLFTGRYLETIGRKRVLMVGALLFFVPTLLYFTVSNMNLLLLVRFIHGAGFGISTTALSTIVIDIIPKERRGEGISYFFLNHTLATSIGPFLGLYLNQHAGFSMIFIVCTILSSISVIIPLFLKIPRPVITEDQSNSLKGFKLSNFFEKKAVPMSLMITIMGFVYSGILSFLTAYATEINLIEAASFFFLVYSITLLISRPFTGKLLDKKGDNFVTYPSILSFAIGLLILSQSYNSFTFLLSSVFIALGFGTMQSCFQAIAIKESPKHRVGLATSTYLICIDFGVGVGPFVLGAVIPMFGFRGLYVTLAIVIFLCIFLYFVLHGKKAANQNSYSQAS
ncbi:MFS transporter [Bacillus timonensis]|uniref:MFS transporter n=1 Tax=Bacillus timonensis TaxID=1033734 RepID=UPI000288E931|nr:MFS transporter [Bacillus timonensis]